MKQIQFVANDRNFDLYNEIIKKHQNKVDELNNQLKTTAYKKNQSRVVIDKNNQIQPLYLENTHAIKEYRESPLDLNSKRVINKFV